MALICDMEVFYRTDTKNITVIKFGWWDYDLVSLGTSVHFIGFLQQKYLTSVIENKV